MYLVFRKVQLKQNIFEGLRMGIVAKVLYIIIYARFKFKLSNHLNL